MSATARDRAAFGVLRWTLLALLGGAFAGCGDIPANNPFDPATPPAQQARGRVTGQLDLPEGFGAERFAEARVALRAADGSEPSRSPVDEQGRFQFEEVLAGQYAVEPTVPGLLATPHPVLVGAGEAIDVGTLPLVVGDVDLRGAVSGRALRGRADGRADGLEIGHAGIRVQAAGSPWVAFTEDDGHFRLEATAGVYTLTFSAPGFGEQRRVGVRLEPGSAIELEELVVLPGQPGRLTGRLVLPPGFAPARLAAVAVALRPADAAEESEPHARTGPSEDGLFLFPTVDPGEWRLDVTADEFLPERHRVRLEPGAALDAGRIELRTRVVDPGDDESYVEGRARLQYVMTDDGHGEVRVEAVDTPFATTTTSDGRFRLAVTPGPHRLRFARAGYGVAIVDADVEAGRGVRLASDVVLPGLPGRVDGRVVLPAGFGVARLQGVTVDLRPLDAPDEAEPTDRVQPADDGLFSFASIAPGGWRIDIASEEFLPERTPVTVEPGATAHLGRVQLRYQGPDEPASAPAVEGRARLQGVAGDEGHGGVVVEALDTPFGTTTTSAGRFLLPVTPGAHRLRFVRAGYGATTVAVRVPAEGRVQLEDEVVLAGLPGQIDGRVVLPGGFAAARLQGVLIDLHAGDAPDDGVPVNRVTPQADGAFSFPLIPPGDWRIDLHSAEFLPEREPVRVAPGAAANLGRIQLRHLGSDGDAHIPAVEGRARLQGQVGDEAHGGIVVEARDTPFATTTASSGRFLLPLTPGAHQLRFTRPGYGAAVAQVEVPEAGTAVIEDDVLLAANPGEVSGRVVLTSFGDPVRLQGTLVTLRPAEAVDDEAGSTERPDAAGHFHFRAVPAGTYELSVETAGYQDARRAITLAAGGALDLGDVDLRHDSDAADAAALTGVVLRPDGVNHGGTRVRARIVSGDRLYREAVTLADGGFTMPASPADAYRLDVERPGYEPASMGPLSWNAQAGRFELAGGGPASHTLRRTEIEGRIEVSLRFLPDWLPAEQLTARVRVTGEGVDLSVEGATAGQSLPIAVVSPDSTRSPPSGEDSRPLS